MITTLKQFILMCVANPDMAHFYFEEEASDDLRDLIYSLSDEDTPEPFRSAMINIGFTDY